MSTLYIAEIDRLGVDAHGASIMSPEMPPIVEQTVSIGMSSTQSAAFGGATTFVQIHCDAICSVAFGSNPTATTSNQRMAQNETRFVAVQRGHKIAVITNT